MECLESAVDEKVKERLGKSRRNKGHLALFRAQGLSLFLSNRGPLWLVVPYVQVNLETYSSFNCQADHVLFADPDCHTFQGIFLEQQGASTTRHGPSPTNNEDSPSILMSHSCFLLGGLLYRLCWPLSFMLRLHMTIAATMEEGATP